MDFATDPSGATADSPVEQDDTHPGDARPLTLLTRPVSPEAAALVSDLVSAVEQHGSRAYRRGAAMQERLALAVGALAGGLLLNASRHGTAEWSWQALGVEAFTGEEVSHRQFHAARDALTTLGLVEVKASFTRYLGTGALKQRFATRFRATPSLLALAEQHGMALPEMPRHWRRKRPKRAPDPLLLRPLAEWIGGKKVKGGGLPVPTTLEAASLAAEIREVNAYVAGFTLDGFDPPLFRRVFTHDLGHGGRWYDTAGHSYQRGSAEERVSVLRIDKKPVVEIDVHASALVTLHGLLGLPLPPGDLYASVGVPREVAKAWIAQTLGKGVAEADWGTLAKAAAEKDGLALALHDPASVQAAALARFPFLAELPRVLACEAQPRLAGLRLDRLESDALTAAMRYLRTVHGVPSLPMHDALIVPASRETMAVEAMKGAWLTVVRAVPTLRVKAAGAA